MQKIKNDLLLSNILKSEDCIKCQSCCKFGEKDSIDAPMFTKEHSVEISKKFNGVAFEPTGILMKIMLKPTNLEGRYICPLYDPKSKLCLIYPERPFDCITWPYYVMKKENKVLITLSSDCKYVYNQNILKIREHFNKKMKDYVINEIRKYPDLIVDYRKETMILLDITKEVQGA